MNQEQPATQAEETGGRTKLPYTSPKLVVHGNVEDITEGSGAGLYTDAAFPARTPIGDLTFS